MWTWFATLLLAVAASPVSAQPESPPPAAPAAPQAPGGGGGAVTLEQDTSGLYFEWGLTAIGAGIAVYTVCRSSRRN